MWQMSLNFAVLLFVCCCFCFILFFLFLCLFLVKVFLGGGAISSCNSCKEYSTNTTCSTLRQGTHMYLNHIEKSGWMSIPALSTPEQVNFKGGDACDVSFVLVQYVDLHVLIMLSDCNDSL